MKTAKKISIIIAVALIVTGALLSFAAVLSLDGDFTRLSSAATVTNTYDIENSFKNISIDIESVKVELAVSESGKCYAVSNEYENLNPTVTVENGTLFVKQTDTRKWHEKIGFFLGDTKITVYLTKAEYENLNITAANGDVKVSDELSFNTARVNVNNGDTDFGASVKNEISAEAAHGNIALEGVTAEKINCKTVSGNIKLTDCDADILKLTAKNGDVNGVLLSDKTFTVDTVNGDKDVPETTGGGICEITTVNGDTTIKIKQ